MEANKTGNFINEKRCELKLTQKELAMKIGVSDKAISKWETGRGMPDLSSLEALSQVFDVTLNELLSGQMLPPEVYEQKAEENMKQLMNENQNKDKLAWLPIVGGELILLIAFVFIVVTSAGVVGLSNLGDTPSFLYMVVVILGVAIINRPKNKKEALVLIRKTALLAGALGSIVGIVCMGVNLEDFSVFGPNLAVAMLPLLYGLVVDLVLLPFDGK